MCVVRRAGILTILMAAASILVGRAQPAPVDLVLMNGTIVTADDRFSVAQAVAVSGERVAAVGTTREIAALAGPATRRIDLHGRTVVPGLIDNHIHALRAMTTWPLEVRLEGVYTRRAAVAALLARAERTGPGGWVFSVGGWTTAQFADDPRPFSRAELDQLLPVNPVVLQESYYQVFLNSRALQAFGIVQGQPDPPDFVPGSIQRDAAGRPTGIIRGDIAATRPVLGRLPTVPPERMEAGALALFAELNRAGLTSLGVPGCSADALEVVRRLRSQNRLTLRIFCIDGPSAASPAQVDVALPVIARTRLFQGDHVIDQVAFGETVYQPLHDRMFATSSAPAPADLDEWRRVATAVAEAGLPLHVHAELATTIDAFLDQIEAINAVRPVRPLRWALAHVNQIGAAQLQRMQRLGLYAAVHPWAVINGGFMHRDFGDAAFDMPALRTIQASGVRWGFGSDGMAANQYPPFTVLGFAVTGRMAGGRQVNRQTIGREDALLAYTRNNASLLFQDGQIGSLQPGKLADLVVLDRAYLAVPAVTIASLRPVMTMIGGRVVYDAGVGPR